MITELGLVTVETKGFDPMQMLVLDKPGMPYPIAARND